jgi:hypothetical protein
MPGRLRAPGLADMITTLELFADAGISVPDG